MRYFRENCIVLELKVVKEIAPIFEAQLLSYMKLLQATKGFLINFNCKNIYEEGSITLVNEFFNKLK
jgi:GxxExxY protein